MHELARVTLQNEMDLILAHKRSMKLAELAGLSLSAQTTFATAVSEVSRNTIDGGKNGCLILSVESEQREKYIVACLKDEQANTDKFKEGLEYAKRLVNKHQVVTNGAEASIELFYHISPSFTIDIFKLDEWRNLFRNEPPLSPYDELKRKNEQLQDLSEKVQKSEAQYKTLTNSLPLTIFSIDGAGKLLYANEWLLKYTGQTLESLNKSRWQTAIHADDYKSFSVLLNAQAIKGTAVLKTQARLKNRTGEYLWHQVSLSPFKNEKDEFHYWIGYIVDIHTQKIFEQTLQDNIELKQTQEQLKENQQTLEKYIKELNRSNLELQQFAFIASHDLQEPVRKLLFYSDYLISKYNDTMDDKGLAYLSNMQQASQRMRSLIQDLLVFSQVTQEGLKFSEVDLNDIVKNASIDFEMAIEEKSATLIVQPLPVINGDKRMMQQLFENIISNALKYSRKGIPPQITINWQVKDEVLELSFADNGIGFDEKYLPQMFTLFQRLHTRDTYEGTGLGLAICRKIVEMHKGKIWARSLEGEGATFYVSLPQNGVTLNV
jgi:PAS domain S-box-containing protein